MNEVETMSSDSQTISTSSANDSKRTWHAEVLVDLIQVFVVWVLLHWLLPTPPAWQGLLSLAFFLFLALLVIRLRGWFLLILIQWGIMMREPRQSMFDPFSLETVLFSMLAVLTIAYLCGYARTRQWLVKFISRWLDQGTWNRKTPNRDQRRVWHRWIRQSIVFGIAILGSVAILRYLPFYESRRRDWFNWSTDNDFIFWPGPTLLLVIFAGWILLREYQWKQLSPRQASLFLRSVFFTAHYSDLRLLLRKKLQYRKQNAVPSSASDSVTAGSPPKL